MAVRPAVLHGLADDRAVETIREVIPQGSVQHKLGIRVGLEGLESSSVNHMRDRTGIAKLSDGSVEASPAVCRGLLEPIERKRAAGLGPAPSREDPGPGGDAAARTSRG